MFFLNFLPALVDLRGLVVEPRLDLGPEHAHRHEERHQDDGGHGARDQDQHEVGHLAALFAVGLQESLLVARDVAAADGKVDVLRDEVVSHALDPKGVGNSRLVVGEELGV